jgi:hypothetical protein
MKWLGVAVGAFFRGAQVTRVRRRARGSRMTAAIGRQASFNGCYEA